MYPIDPLTRKWPQFQEVKSLLEYMGDGEKGMLGYTKCLQNSDVDLASRLIIDQSRSESEIASLRDSLELSRHREQECLSKQVVERENLLVEI